jgi:hypothetical protein
MSKTKSFNVPLPGGVILSVPIGKIYHWRNVTLVIHRPVRDGKVLKKWWNVSEYSTGRVCLDGCFDTRAEAVKCIDVTFPNIKPWVFMQAISEKPKLNQ